MRIVPALGATTPPRIFISVDLPAPFSPTRPITSPRRDAQADAVERDDAGIGLADADELEKRLGHALHACGVAPIAAGACRTRGAPAVRLADASAA